MNQLLIVIPFCKADAEKAERLIEWIFQLHGRRKNGHCLLVSAPDVHPEQIEKNKVSAEVAFDTCSAVKVQQPGVNPLFLGAAKYIMQNYRLPFFWMEPDCSPLHPNWINQLAGSYYAQPKRYNGSFLKGNDDLWTARCIVYPHDAYKDIEPLAKTNHQFNFAARSAIIPAATKHGLVRELLIDTTEAYGNLPANAIAVHGDKNGIAIAAKESELEAAASRRVLRYTTTEDKNL